jgi:hypothetical protein
MELADTKDMMISADYKERFRAEYAQLKIRTTKLTVMLNAYSAGTLDITPACPIDVLVAQKKQMNAYLTTLEMRAAMEQIELGDLQC